jgi:hypothetical protein
MATELTEIAAVLFDVQGIQEFVYASNYVRENIGASYLLDRELYHRELVSVLQELFSPDEPDSLNTGVEAHPLGLLKNQPVAIGYIGGGHALVYFRTKAEGLRAVERFSLRALVRFPSLRLQYGMVVGPLEASFIEQRNQLLQAVHRSRQACATVTTPPNSGLFEECPHTGQLSDARYWDRDERRYLSRIAVAKQEAAERALRALQTEYADTLDNRYVFTNELEKLGQTDASGNFIAVVHIDGNGIGERFSRCESLEDFRALSTAVKDRTLNAFQEMLRTAVAFCGHSDMMAKLGITLKAANTVSAPSASANRYVLPVRPILIGGDDITFVSVGQWGLLLAQRFLEVWGTQGKFNESDGFSACAGIAIVKSHYPFYRAYQIAEAMLKRAKISAKAESPPASYLDFYLLETGVTGHFEKLQQTLGGGGRLHGGPYRIGGHDVEMHSLNTLIETIDVVKRWPASVRHAVRDRLRGSKEALQQYWKETLRRHEKIVDTAALFPRDPKFWIRDADPCRSWFTYYDDAIQLAEFFSGHNVLTETVTEER